MEGQLARAKNAIPSAGLSTRLNWERIKHIYELIQRG
jgi:hypothetical protein